MGTEIGGEEKEKKKMKKKKGDTLSFPMGGVQGLG